MKKQLEMVCTECDHVFTANLKNRNCPRCNSQYIEVNRAKTGKKPPRKDKWIDN